MKILVPFIEMIYGLLGNYGITIVLSIILLFLVLIPFQYLNSVNKKKKEMAKPRIKEIQKKYNANMLGVSEDDDVNLNPELKKYTKDERDEMMSNEISAVYKEVGYHAFTGWIPGALVFVLIVLLYGGISGACPEGFYQLKFSMAYAEKNIMAIAILAAPVVLNFVISLIAIVKAIIKYKKKGKAEKTTVIMEGVAAVVCLAFVVFVMFSTNVAISIAILCLSCMNKVRTFIEERKEIKSKAKQEATTEA